MKSLEAWATENKQWADTKMLRDLGLVSSLKGSVWDVPPSLGTHKILEPWRDQILQTAVPAAEFFFADVASDQEPREGELAFGRTRVRWVEEIWPKCSCGKEMRSVFQFPLTHLRPFLLGDGYLSGFYCLSCLPRGYRESDSTKAILRIHQSSFVISASGQSADSTSAVLVPFWDFPDPTMWDGSKVEQAAVSPYALGKLFELGEVVGKPDEMRDAYLAWVSPQGGYESPFAPQPLRPIAAAPPGFRSGWRSQMGGYPDWDQADRTPTCEACNLPMRHLMSVNAGMFLDGSWHVFFCDKTSHCKGVDQFLWVAEF